MSITFARFENQNVARKASRKLRKLLGKDARVELIRNLPRLSHHVIPLRWTAIRTGAAIGGVVVALLSLLAITGLLALGVSEGPITVPAETLLLTLLLSGILGALAGALSFASDSSAATERMRGWLEGGKPVVIVDARRTHEDTMRHCGASVVDKIV